MQLLLVVAVIALVVGLAWRARRGTARTARPVDRIDTVIGWPPQATMVMSRQERIAFDTLRRAAPECIVLAQVSLSRFIEVPKRNSYADWLRRIGYQSVDFIICNRATEVLAVVELQAQQPSELALKRLARIRRIVKTVQLPLHVWREGQLPTVDEVRESLFPKHEAPAFPSGTIAPGAVYSDDPDTLPIPGRDESDLRLEPMTASGSIPFDDLAEEEARDRREAPPSTWYDDLDSVRVPLGKR